jgi:hypothetical protein
LDSQLGPQLLFTSQHLIAPGGNGIPHPVTGAPRHLAGRPSHFDDQGVGMELGRGLFKSAANLALCPQ